MNSEPLPTSFTPLDAAPPSDKFGEPRVSKYAMERGLAAANKRLGELLRTSPIK